MPCWPCASSRPSSPAREPDVSIEPPRKPGVQPCLARRAALRIRLARRAALRASPANPLCASSRLANPGERPCLASRSCGSRRANPPCASSRFAKPPCELPPPNVRRRQDFAVVRSTEAGAMATYARDALSAVRRRRDAREMRSQAPGCGKFSPWCVPGRPFVAIFSLHASPKEPRTGKAPLPGNISPPCIQNELALARYARHVSEKRRKSPFGNA